MCFNSAMEVIISYFLAVMIYNGVYSGSVEVYGNTFTRILNRNYTDVTVMSVRSKLECSMVCMTTKYCKAFAYEKDAGNSKCFPRKYKPNILYPLIIDPSLPVTTSVIFLQKPQHVWIPRDDYSYDTILKFWYRVVMSPKANATDASDACKADGAYLMFIRHKADYDFLIKLQDQLGVNPVMYLQGTRQTKNDDYVDELGRPLPFFQWDVNGISGGGLYLRTNADRVMETSRGSSFLRYICQILLN